MRKVKVGSVLKLPVSSLLPKEPAQIKTHLTGGVSGTPEGEAPLGDEAHSGSTAHIRPHIYQSAADENKPANLRDPVLAHSLETRRRIGPAEAT